TLIQARPDQCFIHTGLLHISQISQYCQSAESALPEQTLEGFLFVPACREFDFPGIGGGEFTVDKTLPHPPPWTMKAPGWFKELLSGCRAEQCHQQRPSCQPEKPESSQRNPRPPS